MAYDGHLTFDTHIDEKGFSAGIDKLGSIAKGGLSLLGGAIAGVTAGMTAAIGASEAVGSEFEAQMSRVQAISGATSEEFAALRDQAIQLGADTSFSASSAAMGMENLAAAGFAVTEIMDAMPGMLDLAAASGEDLASSADIAASALRGFGLEASEAGHVADVLAANANMTNSSVADTGEALKYIAPLARAAGVSLEETAAAIGIMANAGIQGSQAGTTLRGAGMAIRLLMRSILCRSFTFLISAVLVLRYMMRCLNSVRSESPARSTRNFHQCMASPGSIKSRP